MHAIERPYLSRVGLTALGVMLVAIIVLLLAASRLDGIGASSPSNATGAAVGPAAAVHPLTPAGVSPFTDALATPFRVVVSWTTPHGR